MFVEHRTIVEKFSIFGLDGRRPSNNILSIKIMRLIRRKESLQYTIFEGFIQITGRVAVVHLFFCRDSSLTIGMTVD
jgi:hypothetical protein